MSMESIKTIICKLNPTPEQVVDIESTIDAFTKACEFAAETARTIDSTNRFKVHHECYNEIRNIFGLSANLTITAIARACAALKTNPKTLPKFKPNTVDYDARIFSIFNIIWVFSLTLISGRAKIQTSLGEFQKAALKGHKPTRATLVKHIDGNYYLHIQIKDNAPNPIKIKNVLGVDIGVVSLAVDSSGTIFSGRRVEEVRKRYEKRRRNLQRNGTKSAKRRLRKIRKKEARFRANENHIISKRLVQSAKDTSSAIAIEELTGIGQRTTVCKSQRSRLKGWAFHQLRKFIEYKALATGVTIIVVDPRNTSRTCSKCKYCHKSNRKSQSKFFCKRCNFSCNADWNASQNIRNIGLKSCSLTVSSGTKAGVVDSRMIP